MNRLFPPVTLLRIPPVYRRYRTNGSKDIRNTLS